MQFLLDESILSLRDAAKMLGTKADSRPIHLSTLIRWRTRGLRGVRLEAIRIGGRWFTSREAVVRFVSARAFAMR